MKAEAIFEPLENLESCTALLYRAFSEKLNALPAATMLFYRMSLEEKAHLALVRYQKRLVAANPEMFGELNLDLKHLTEVAARIRAHRKDPRPLSLEKAVAFALEVEADFAESHFKIAILDIRPELSALMWSLNLADKMHLSGLREFAARNGMAYLL